MLRTIPEDEGTADARRELEREIEKLERERNGK